MTVTNVLQPCVLKKCKMAAVSAKVFKHHKKADGTFNVKICLIWLRAEVS
jgi:hypothetical protein